MKKKNTAFAWVRSISLVLAAVFMLSMAMDIPYVNTMEVQAATSKSKVEKKASSVIKKAKVKSKDSKKNQLQTAYKYVEKKWKYKRTTTKKVKKSTWTTYAYDMMNDKKGTCWNWAAGYAAIAKEILGDKYTVRISVGKAIMNKSVGYQDHAWVEIKKNSSKTWYICDPEMNVYNSTAKSKTKYFYKKTTSSTIKKNYKISKAKHITVSF